MRELIVSEFIDYAAHEGQRARSSPSSAARSRRLRDLVGALARAAQAVANSGSGSSCSSNTIRGPRRSSVRSQ